MRANPHLKVWVHPFSSIVCGHPRLMVTSKEHRRGCVTAFLQEQLSLRSAKSGDSKTVIRGDHLSTEDS